MRAFLTTLSFLAFLAAPSFVGAAYARAATTCVLDHPDRDIKRLFAESTTYRVRELLPQRHGSKGLMPAIAKELGAELDRELETSDTPYTFYAVYKDTTQIGLVLGSNSRLESGPLQLFVAYSRDGKIRDIYVQRISSSEAASFRSKYYREQFRRFGLGALPEEADIKPPHRAPTAQVLRDHHAFIRAVRLNILIVKGLYNGSGT